jgi:tripartite-type tricarboxylate transporter receptor subunit TctC
MAGGDKKGFQTPLMGRRAICRGLALTPLLLAGAKLAAPQMAGAQAKYPERPVRIIVPFGAGGVADITTRLVGEKLGNKLGQRFVIENVPGAGGISAARAALAAPADGYTITLLTNGTAISVPLFKSLPFDPLKDFVPISSVGYFDCVFVANATSDIKTMADFVKAAKAKPGVINMGTINVGSTQNLSAELLKSTADINFVIIPFRTTPEAVVALLRNDIQMVVDFPAALQAGLSDHKLTAVAATGPVSAKSLGVPTVAQAGVPGYEVTSWNALYAPAATPKEAIEILNRALREVLADPDLKRRALDLGIDTRAAGAAEMDAQMRGDIDKWSKVIAHANIPKL